MIELLYYWNCHCDRNTGIGNDAVAVTKAKADDVIGVSFTASEQLHGTAADNNTVKFIIGTNNDIPVVELTETEDDSTTPSTWKYSGSYTLSTDNADQEAGDVKYVIKITDLAGNSTTNNEADAGINVNNTKPSLTAGSDIALGNSQTPSYTFQSSEVGTVSISGTNVGLSAGDTIVLW